MIGKTCVNGCTLGGWYTDMWNAIKKGVSSSTEIAAQLLNLYRAGQLSPEEYNKLQIELAKAQASGSVSSGNTIIYVGLAAAALVAVALIAKK